VQDFNQSPVSTAKWHITSLVYRRCIRKFLFTTISPAFVHLTNIKNVCKTNQNL